jgi:hypothetical protein
MSYKIDPNDYCTKEGCNRPKATGEAVCSQCSRLARAIGADLGIEGAASTEAGLELQQTYDDALKPPRCIAYLSMAGDVITLELTGEPKFTEADVEAVAAVLSNFRKAA